MATSITLTTNSSTSEYTLATGGRGPAGGDGLSGTQQITSTTTPGEDDRDAIWFDPEYGSFSVWYVDAWVGAGGGGGLPTTITGLTSVTSTTFVGALTGNATTSSSTTGNAATVTTNANLTGPVTSTGNATAIANGAISNAMLANGAVANLAGSNTGDETAARIITLLGLLTKADLATANTDLAIGSLFYNTALSKLDITTA